jgi:hypothetical protein
MSSESATIEKNSIRKIAQDHRDINPANPGASESLGLDRVWSCYEVFLVPFTASGPADAGRQSL